MLKYLTTVSTVANLKEMKSATKKGLSNHFSAFIIDLSALSNPLKPLPGIYSITPACPLHYCMWYISILKEVLVETNATVLYPPLVCISLN